MDKQFKFDHLTVSKVTDTELTVKKKKILSPHCQGTELSTYENGLY